MKTFTAAGAPTSPTIPIPDLPVNPVVAADGKIYVGTQNGDVLTFDASGAPTPPFSISVSLGNRISVTVDAAGTIYAANTNLGTVQAYTAAGTSIGNPVSIVSPLGMAVR